MCEENQCISTYKVLFAMNATLSDSYPVLEVKWSAATRALWDAALAHLRCRRKRLFSEMRGITSELARGACYTAPEQIKELQAKNAKQASALKRKEWQLLQAQSSLDGACVSLRAATELNQELRRQVDVMTQKLTSLQNTVQALRSSESSCKQELKDLINRQSTHAEAQQAMEDKEIQIQKYQQLHQSAVKEVDRLMDVNERQAQQVKELTQTLKKKQYTIKEMQHNLREAQNEVLNIQEPHCMLSLQNELETLKADHLQQSQQCKRLGAESVQCKVQLTLAQQDAKAMRDQIRKLSQEHEDLKACATNEMSRLNEIQRQTKDQVTVLTVQLRDTSQALEQSRIDNDGLKTSLDTLQEQMVRTVANNDKDILLRDQACTHLLLNLLAVSLANVRGETRPDPVLQMHVHLIQQPLPVDGCENVQSWLERFLNRQRAAKALIQHVVARVLNPRGVPPELSPSMASALVHSCMNTAGMTWKLYRKKALRNMHPDKLKLAQLDSKLMHETEEEARRLLSAAVFPPSLNNVCTTILNYACCIK